MPWAGTPEIEVKFPATTRWAASPAMLRTPQNWSNVGRNERSRTPFAVRLAVRRWVESPAHASWKPLNTVPSTMWMPCPSPSQRCPQRRAPDEVSCQDPWLPTPPWATARRVPPSSRSSASAMPCTPDHVIDRGRPAPSVRTSHGLGWPLTVVNGPPM